MNDNLTIEDLEKYSGLSTRTLHYYMAKGLLPGPETRGKNATYTQEHLDRLDLILKLKELHLPLEKIKQILDQLTPDEISEYLNFQIDLKNTFKINNTLINFKNDNSSALDYLKGLEAGQTAHQFFTFDDQSLYKNNFKFISPQKDAIEPQRVTSQPKPEIWRRIVLDDGVELNIRETRDQDARYKIERLLSFARSLFAER